MEFTVNEIAHMLGGEIVGRGDGKISMLAKIQEAKNGQIAFLSNPKYEHFIYETDATAVIVRRDFVPRKDIRATLVKVEDPYVSFTTLLEEYHKLISFQKAGIEEPCYLGKNSSLGTNIYRGAFSYIGNNTVIGNNAKIYPHTYIGDNVRIGNDTILHSGVRIYADTVIGDNCVIHSGTVIGSDGFGFAPQDDGTYKTIPQLGRVVIEDNVAIGANTVIDCATFAGDATLIRSGVKLDNLIQVAHNVEIGKNTVIAAQTGISGSTKVGENCMLAGQVGIAGHLVIANNTSLGAQAGVSKSVTKEGQRLLGYPVFDVKEYFRSYAVFKKLPDISYRLKELEQKVNALSNHS